MTQDFLIPVADLLDREAPPRDVIVEAPVDWSIELSRIEPAPPMTADLTLSPLPGGILGRGTVSFRVEHTCRRCLTPYEEDVSLDVTGLFEITPEEDAYPIDGDQIDLEPFLRDETLLAMPLLPQCPGGCVTTVATPETDPDPVVASHWEPLRDWRAPTD